MPEIRNKTYRSIGEATFGHKVFRQGFIPFAAMTTDVAYTDNDMIVDFTGWSRQSFTVLPLNAGSGPTLDVEIQEFVPDADDPAVGDWATKSGLGVGVAQMDVLFEHNQEDVVRLSRIVITPRTSVPANGVKFEISGRRHT